jgi:exosortase D (VPLPA-CTERM-specific)
MLVRAVSYEPSEAVAKSRAMITAIAMPLAVLLAIAAFSPTLRELVSRWSRQEEYSHGFLIPIIAAWLLWSRRDVLVVSIGRPSWTGPALIFLAALMHIVGELSSLYLLSQLGFIVALFGIVSGCGGYPLLKVSFVPIIFMIFAIPTPYFIDTVLSWRLQLMSSELGVSFIRMLQIPVYLEGNVIDLGTYKLQVVEACSGLRYLYPLLSLSFLAAYLFQAPIWQRVLVFLSAIPITIVMNSFRIAVVGVLVDNWGIEQAEGMLHLFEGWIIFIACAGMLAGEMYFLAKLTSGKMLFQVFYPPKVKAGLPDGQQFQPAMRWPLVCCVFLLCATGLTGLFVSGRQEIVPERVIFASFPTSVGQWRGRPTSLDPQTEHFLGLTDYILSDFTKSDGRTVNFYVAYYASQRQGLSPHSPAVCIPGNGWQITSFQRSSFSSNNPTIAMPLNRAVIEKNSSKELVYYWFEQRGRKIANEWWSKAYLLADAIFQNRTDGALIRLTTPVYPGEIESDADRRLRGFIRDFVPPLRPHLPSEPQRQAMPVLDRFDVNHS